MPFIKPKCSQCGRVAETDRQFQIGTKLIHWLKCGHMASTDQIEVRDATTICSSDGKRLYPFQQTGVRFIEQSGGRVLIDDEMGLGKTVQALAFLGLHEEAFPVLIVLKASLLVQWQHETFRWTGKFAQIISDARLPMIPGVPVYIVSYDLLRRFNGNFLKMVKDRGIKTVILDECQQIKNPTAQRTKEVRDICRAVDNVIALSGTPIKNNAGEFFSILNILDPVQYHSHSRFLAWDCISEVGAMGHRKVGGLRDPEDFHRKTKHFILRRTRAEVRDEIKLVCGDKPDRQFRFTELGKEVEAAYIDTFKKFQDEYNSAEDLSNFERSSNILAYLAKMRHLVGLSKIKPCVDFVCDFLMETDRKLTIFVQHKDVGILLKQALERATGADETQAVKVLSLTSDMNSDDRNATVLNFMRPDGPRILIASTLASGEGLNLQKCSDCVMLERQWNPANEEQAESRFIRIGQEADVVTATYLVALGTVDEFFAKLVEQKREIVTQTLDKSSQPWDESSLMKELTDILAREGGKPWGL